MRGENIELPSVLAIKPKEIDELKARVAELEKTVNELKSKIERARSKIEEALRDLTT